MDILGETAEHGAGDPLRRHTLPIDLLNELVEIEACVEPGQ